MNSYVDKNFKYVKKSLNYYTEISIYNEVKENL